MRKLSRSQDRKQGEELMEAAEKAIQELYDCRSKLEILTMEDGSTAVMQFADNHIEVSLVKHVLLSENMHKCFVLIV